MKNTLFAPAYLGNIDAYRKRVFLAGSIDIGAAEDWQMRAEENLAAGWGGSSGERERVVCGI